MKILTIILLISISACGQSSTKGKSEINSLKGIEEWKTLELSNYSIQYPENWELDQSGQLGSSFILFSPLESEKDKFKENVNLLIQDLTGLNIDINKYTQISTEQVEKLVTNSNLIESKRIKKGKDEFHKLIYSGDQGIFHLQFEQYYWIINEKAFILTFTAEKDKLLNFKEIGEKILNSFILRQ